MTFNLNQVRICREVCKMKLYKEILLKILSNNDLEVTFKGIEFDYNKLLENKTYLALEKIKTILQDESTDDKSCLEKIEKIVATYETLPTLNEYDFSN